MALVDALKYPQGLYSDVAPHLVPSGNSESGGGLLAMSNVNTYYKIGSILKRPGYGKIGTALEAGKSILSLHNFRQSTSIQKMLATVDDATSDDTQLFYGTGGSWTEITGAETAWANKAGIAVEMEDFLGYCFFVGWGSTDGFITPSSLTGTTFSTSTNVTSMPNAKFITRYRDRLYIANTDISGTATPYRVYYSSIPTAGAITWTVATDFFDVDYSEAITGISTNWDRLMVFTEYRAYMVTQSPLTKKQVWDTGCSAHRTIKNLGALMIWANRDGVYVSPGGSYPQNVAGRAIDFIRYSNMTTAFAEIVDEEYHLYLGAVTVNGISYANCSLILSLPTMTWRLNEYADTLGSMGKFYATGQDSLYLGATDGEIHKLGKYIDSTLQKTDNGTPIHSFFQTGHMDFGMPSGIKRFNKIFAYADRAQGLFLRARAVDENAQAVTKWMPLGELKKYISEFQVNPEKGYFLQVEGAENGSNEYWSFYGFTAEIEIDRPPQK